MGAGERICVLVERGLKDLWVASGGIAVDDVVVNVSEGHNTNANVYHVSGVAQW